MKKKQWACQDVEEGAEIMPASVDLPSTQTQIAASEIGNAPSAMLSSPPDPAFFISIHIPKTAGTTLGNIFDVVSSRHVLFDYPSFQFYDKPDPLLTKHADFIRQYFRCVHGHFNVKRQLPVFGSAKFISCVRHPVERIISQYLHEYNTDDPQAIYHVPILSGDLSIVDFARLEGIGDAMARHLDGLAISDYDLLLVTEELITSLNVLNYVVGNLNIERYYGVPPKIPHENAARSRSTHLIFDEATRRAIFECAAPDVEVYAKAVEAMHAKARRFSR